VGVTLPVSDLCPSERPNPLAPGKCSNRKGRHAIRTDCGATVGKSLRTGTVTPACLFGSSSSRPGQPSPLEAASTSLFGSSVAEPEGANTLAGPRLATPPSDSHIAPPRTNRDSTCNPFTGGRSSAPVLTCVSNSGAYSVVSEISEVLATRRQGAASGMAQVSFRAHEPEGVITSATTSGEQTGRDTPGPPDSPAVGRVFKERPVEAQSKWKIRGTRHSPVYFCCFSRPKQAAGRAGAGPEALQSTGRAPAPPHRTSLWPRNRAPAE
jgi:hypothetical protein